MQTFLPFDDFAASARVLDNRRLGKQRVETLQILQVLLGFRLVTSLKDAKGKKTALPREKWTFEAIKSKGWKNHPAVKMWRGSEGALLKYQEAVCNEWTSRGYKDTCLEKSRYLYSHLADGKGQDYPWWLGVTDIHRTHQANLLRKAHTMSDAQIKTMQINPDFYDRAFPNVPDDLEYYWPAEAPAKE